MSGVIGVVSALALVLNFWVAFQRWREWHARYQESRLRITGWTLPWWMCWTYRVGLDERVPVRLRRTS